MIYKYFSAGNTPSGFINHFDKVMDFDTASQIIYIKGGSGVGKSTLMKKVSACAEAKGYDIHHIYCSSDKNSLDGVIVPSKGIALFDATMPHISDPLYPRVNGRIVDLGIFLDTSTLLTHKADIIALTKDKKQHYKNMYSLLATLNGINKAIENTIEKDDILMHNIAKEIVHNIGMQPIYPTEGFLSLIDGDGYLDKTVGILDKRKCYSIISSIKEVSTDLVSQIDTELRYISHARFYSVISPKSVETIATKNEIITSSNTIVGDIVYNIDNMISIKNRHTYNVLLDMETEIISLASNEISEASKAHHEIENIYQLAMDYESLSTLQDEIVRSLLD